MRKNVFVALIAAVALLGATAASAYEVSVTLNTGSTSIANGYVDNGDGTITANLTAGDIIGLDIWAANAAGDTITGVFTSLAHDATLVGFLGGGFSGAILTGTCSGFGCTPPSLAPGIGSPQSKPNDPNSQATGTEDWIQVVAHTNTGGTNGTGAAGLGDYVGLVGFQVTGGTGFSKIDFILGNLAGDGVSAGVNSESYGSLIFNVPEPGTALLMGLGLMGLGAAGRRENA